MLKKSTIFDYLTNVMVIWGISILSLSLFCFLFGESAREYSTIFELGNAGLSVTTLIQFLCLAVVISALRWTFFTDVLIKKLSILVRSILMFASVIATVGVFAAVCKWFPVNQVLPWVMFFVSFTVCALVSVAVSVLKEKGENKKMQEALERLKGEEF